MSAGLRLLGQSVDDLPVVSSLLQDAVLRVADIAYDPRGRRLAVLLGRYRWEADRSRTRVRSLLRIDSVVSLQRRGLSQADGRRVLEVLALTGTKVSEDAEDPRAVLTLRCAGGADLRLSVEAVDLLLEDVSNPWGTKRRPDHGL
jgi:hypothetical protein